MNALPTTEIDMRPAGAVESNMANFHLWLANAGENTMLEVFCPHIQCRDFLGQSVLDANQRLGRLAYRLALFHVKNFSETVSESFSVIVTKLAMPNRKERRSAKAKTKKRK